MAHDTDPSERPPSQFRLTMDILFWPGVILAVLLYWLLH
jgi:hypothetical protein